MVTAVFGYALILLLGLIIQVEGETGLVLWAYRIGFVITALFLVLTTFNYRNVQKLMPLCHSENRFMRWLGVALLDLEVMVGVPLLLVVLASFFSKSL